MRCRILHFACAVALSAPTDADATHNRCDPLAEPDDCAFWAATGECEANQPFMNSHCAPTCGVCHTPPATTTAVSIDAAADAADADAIPIDDDDSSRAAAAAERHVLLVGPASDFVRKPLALRPNESVEAVAVGEEHLLLLTSAGDILALGSNSLGQLGRPFVTSPAPFATWRAHRLTFPQTAGRAKSISAGRFHSAAVLSGGAIVAWGENSQRQLGRPLEEVPQEEAAAELDFLDIPLLTRPTRVPIDGHAVAVACGERHTLGLLASGEVWGWGDNTYGQLGQATEHASSPPVAVQLPLRPDERVAAVAAGAYHSLALTSKGRLICWGDNSFGQLGSARGGFVSSILSSASPSQDEFEAEHAAATNPSELSLGLLPGESIASISTGPFHSAAVTTGGRLLLWGDNSLGQLGVEAANHSSVGESDFADPLGPAAGAHIVRVAIGEHHTIAITNASDLFSFGSNERGQLGRVRGAQYDEVPGMPALPVAAGDALQLCAAGPYFTAAVTRAGSLIVWGEHPSTTVRASPASDASGVGHARSRNAAAGALRPDEAGLWGEAQALAHIHVANACVGGFHQVAASARGQHFSWGENAARQLCRRVANGADFDDEVVEVVEEYGLGGDGEGGLLACGGFHTLFSTSDGALFACGGSARGELDDEEAAEESEESEAGPTLAPPAAPGVRPPLGGDDGNLLIRRLDLPSRGTSRLVALAAGHVHSLALEEGGRLWSWGADTFGQLGRSDPERSRRTYEDIAPGMVELKPASAGAGDGGIDAVPRVVRIAAGAHHSLAVTEDGQLWTWGCNAHGQLGRDHRGQRNGDSSVPAPANLPRSASRVVDAAAGAYHSAVLLDDGRICVFGDNGSGQLGQEAASRAEACNVLGDERGVQLAAGELHTVVLTRSGAVLSWGANIQQQLGRGDAPYVARVGAMELDALNEGEAVVAVAAGGYSTALRTSRGRLILFGVARGPPAGLEADEDVPDDEGAAFLD